MKKALLTMMAVAIFYLPALSIGDIPQETIVPSQADQRCQWINGYYRKDGTYVRGHWRGC